MSNLKERLIEYFPHHRLNDEWDFESQQFTAEDMLEFSRQFAEEVIKEASERAQIKTVEIFGSENFLGAPKIIDKQSILNLIDEL